MRKGSKLQGRYLLHDEVAAGAMGTIYSATDERLGRQVAVKIPRAELRSEENFLERFRREALAAASLSHPNVASVFDYGEENGQPFIVMELVNGRDLARILTEGPLAAERAIWIASQVCSALQHAHGIGIVHRDVKPGNVIVCEEEGDRVKVTDFGIAHATGDMTLTATGSLFGTPQYLSPEQAQGERATSRSDIYSLGIVLFEMLTGQPPFVGDNAVTVALRHVNEEIPAPSSINPKLSPELDALVANATAREPGQRFATAEEMVAALNSLGTGAPQETITHAHEEDAAATLIAEPMPGPSATQTLTDAEPVAARTSELPARGWGSYIPSLGGTEKMVAGGVLVVVCLLLAVVFWGGDSNDSPSGSKQNAQQQQSANDDVHTAIDELEELIGR
jgi:serine/threonine-protein kinase